MTGMIRHPALAALVVGGGVASADGGLCAEPSGASDRTSGRRLVRHSCPHRILPRRNPQPLPPTSTPLAGRSHAGDRASRRGRLPSRRPAPPGCDGAFATAPPRGPGRRARHRGAARRRHGAQDHRRRPDRAHGRGAGLARPPARRRRIGPLAGGLGGRGQGGGRAGRPGRLLPAISPGGYDAWRAGPLDPADEEWLARLAAAFPPPAHALPVEGSRPLRVRSPRASLVRELLGRGRRLPWRAARRRPRVTAHPRLRRPAARVGGGRDARVARTPPPSRLARGRAPRPAAGAARRSPSSRSAP